MWGLLRRKLRFLYSRISWLLWKRPRSKVVIRRFRKLNFKYHSRPRQQSGFNKTTTSPSDSVTVHGKPIRIATFNVAMFSLAPAVSEADELGSYSNNKGSSMKVAYPKSILKHSPLHAPLSKVQDLSDSKILPRSNLKVSINLPENEISKANSRLLDNDNDNEEGTSRRRSQVPARSPVYFSPIMNYYCGSNERFMSSSRSILEVLREIDADVLALQDVKAVEEKSMKPLSDLAAALGMKFVFAESWAPEYGNAILSKWPIKRWKVQKIADDDDFRNVLKATIEVPGSGEINFHSTQLDHLDENWRMKQVNAIVSYNNDPPQILAGGLNSLDAADYSSERWTDIVKYYEKLGKPRPKTEVMKYMKSKEYVDAKDYAGECEPIVIMAKGQNVQGTCKYGTRVDYILSSPDSPYEFVPGSYSVVSSKGTSDHHIVKVDIVKVNAQKNVMRRCRKLKHKVKRIAPPCSDASNVWELTPPPKSSCSLEKI